MSFPASDNFSKHSENLRSIDKTLVQVERTHKRAIRENDVPSVAAMRKIHVLLVGVRAEAALRKIVEDPTGFNDRERELIWKNRTQETRWAHAVELAARRHFAVPVHLDVKDVAPAAVADRLESLERLLKGDLAPVITGRNKIAHGQWDWQLKSGRDDQFLADSMNLDFNYIEIDSRHRIIKSISEAVHVLAVSEPTFDREFDRISSAVDTAKMEIDGSGYEDFVKKIRASRRQRASV